jgi:hypothetical protein
LVLRVKWLQRSPFLRLNNCAVSVVVNITVIFVGAAVMQPKPRSLYTFKPGTHLLRPGEHRIEGALYLSADDTGHFIFSSAGGALQEYLDRVPEALVEELWPHPERHDGAA